MPCTHLAPRDGERTERCSSHSLTEREEYVRMDFYSKCLSMIRGRTGWAGLPTPPKPLTDRSPCPACSGPSPAMREGSGDPRTPYVRMDFYSSYRLAECRPFVPGADRDRS